MKKNVVRILTAVLMLSVVFSSSVFAAEKEQSAWDSFVGLFTGNAVTVADTQVDGVTYRTHIQNDGWAQGWVSDGDMSGSEGRGLRLEGIEIKIDGDTLPDGLGITYRTHIENDGWAQGWVEDGEMSGSYGRGLRLEAIEIKLTGDNADDYTVLYRTHIQNDGWAQGWVADGELSGSEGRGLRLEGIEIKIEQKTADLTEYEAALADVTQADYTAASWTAYQAVVNANVVDEDNLQSEVDEATAAITAAQANLVLVPKVTSVTAINAKQIQIAFNKAMDKTTLINTGLLADTSDDVLNANMVEISVLDGQTGNKAVAVANANAVLSADGKTLTLTATAAEYFAGRYAIGVTTNVKDSNQINLPSKSVTNINVVDTARPTLVGVTYENYQSALVGFSEDLNSAGTVTFKYSDGTAVTGASGSLGTTGVQKGKVVINLSSASIVANKDIVVTIVGATDYANNIISPNPVTVTVKKDTTATVKPEVTKVTATSTKTFDIKFSKALMTAPTTVTVDSSPVQTATIAVDPIDATIYHATVTTALTGVRTISYNVFTDIYGVQGDASTKVLSFTADTAAPVISSSKVEKINGIEYLVLTYNENVATVNAKSIAGSYIDNYVTTPITPLLTAAANSATESAFTLYNAVDGKSASVKLDLSKLTKSAEYTVTLPAGLVTDLFSNSSAEVTNFKFTRTSNISTAAPKLDITKGDNTDGVTVSTANNDTLTLYFDRPVAGATAINKANYSVEGATVENAVLDLNSTFGQVTLTLVKDSNTLSGVRGLTVSGVTSQSGDVMETITVPVTLKENVRPLVKSAKVLTTSTIEVTFTENLGTAGLAGTDDFTVKSGTSTLAYTGAAAGTTADVVIITLTSPLSDTELTSALTLQTKVGGTTPIKDVNGNVVNPNTVTITNN